MSESGAVILYKIARGKHKVVFAHEPGDIESGVLDVEWSGYGKFSTDRGVINTRWGADVVRERPHVDDQYPLSMPSTISNLTVYAEAEDAYDGVFKKDDPDYDHTKMDHLHTQPEARGKGYGTMMWDIYVCISAAVSGYVTGKIGETEDDATRRFLRRNGVPDEDIDPAAWTDIEQDDIVYDDEAGRVVGIVGHRDDETVDVEPLDGGTKTLQRDWFHPDGRYRAIRL